MMHYDRNTPQGLDRQTDVRQILSGMKKRTPGGGIEKARESRAYSRSTKKSPEDKKNAKNAKNVNRTFRNKNDTNTQQQQQQSKW